MAAAREAEGRAGTAAGGTRGVAAGEGRNEAKHWLLGKQLEEEPQEQEVHIFGRNVRERKRIVIRMICAVALSRQGQQREMTCKRMVWWCRAWLIRVFAHG